MTENKSSRHHATGEANESSVEKAAERLGAPGSNVQYPSADEELPSAAADGAKPRISLIERSTLAQEFRRNETDLSPPVPEAEARPAPGLDDPPRHRDPAGNGPVPGRAPPPPPYSGDPERAYSVEDRYAPVPPRSPEPPPEPPRRRGFWRTLWAIIRFILIGKKKRKRAGRQKAPAGRATRLGILRFLRRRRVAPEAATDVPGMAPRSAAPAEETVAPPPQMTTGPPEDGRPGNVATHMRRPLDLSRRVGRTVTVDIERLRMSGLVAPFGERSQIAEEFRLIKRPLLLNAFEKGAKAIRNGNIIMVASSRSGEGKTFTAVNLAMSIASERDLTVLLIDADVAKPDIPSVLGFDADLGLVDLIAEESLQLSDVILRTNIDNLSVIPAGRPHHLATELLASERMGQLVSEISLRYPERVIVMDSPPALLSSIASVLALNVGQILFVVEAERTSQTAVDSAIGLVSACKNINLLLNKSRPLGVNERFGSYNSYYYR